MFVYLCAKLSKTIFFKENYLVRCRRYDSLRLLGKIFHELSIYLSRYDSVRPPSKVFGGISRYVFYNVTWATFLIIYSRAIGNFIMLNDCSGDAMNEIVNCHVMYEVNVQSCLKMRSCM